MSWDHPSVIIAATALILGGIHYWSRWTLAREMDVPQLRKDIDRMMADCSRTEAGVERHDNAIAERIRVDHDLAEKIHLLPHSLRAYFVNMDQFNYAIQDSVKDRQKIWEAIAEMRNDSKEIWKVLNSRGRQ